MSVTCTWWGRQHSTATHAKITRSFGWCTQKYSKENRKQASFMSKTWFYSLAPLFWFYCFLIRTLIYFVLLFINVAGVKTLTTMLIPGTTLIKNGSSFPLPRLLRAPRILKMAHLSHHHAYSGQHVYSRGKSNQIIVNPLHRR